MKTFEEKRAGMDLLTLNWAPPTGVWAYEMLAPHQKSLHCLALVCTFGIICIGRCCADWLIERTLDPCASQTAIYKLQCCITPHTSYINATEAQKLSTQKFLCKDCLSGCQQIISLSSNIILIMDGAELSWEHCLNQSMLECQIGKDGRMGWYNYGSWAHEPSLDNVHWCQSTQISCTALNSCFQKDACPKNHPTLFLVDTPRYIRCHFDMRMSENVTHFHSNLM